MANTMHGAYAPTTWVNSATPISQQNMNNLETQAGVALHSFNPYLISAGFVLSGATCTKDGTNANQLDIASGTAFLIQSDGTLAQCDIAADNTHITSGATATWHLYLQPDGTWYWNTANTPAANSLFIAQVTTDASGNINGVTDKRPLNVELLSAMSNNGLAFVDVQALGLLAPDLGAGMRGSLGHLDGTNGAFSNAFFFNTPMSGAAPQGYYFASWSGSALKIPFSIGGQFGGASTWVDAAGNIYGSIGGGPQQALWSGSSVTLSGTYQDVPGCTLTLSVAGKYLVMGAVSAFHNGTGGCSLALNVNGTRQGLTGYAGPTYIGTTGTFQGTYQVSQTWVVTVGASQVVKLQVAGTGTAPSGDPTSGSTADSAITAQYLHS